MPFYSTFVPKLVFMTNIYDFHRYYRTGTIPLHVSCELSGNHPERNFHAHNFSEMVMVIEGTAEHLTVNRKYLLKKGDILSLHPGTIHAYDKCRSFKIINVLYDSRTLAMPVLDAAQMPSFHRLFPIKENITEEQQSQPVINLDNDKFNEITSEMMHLKTVLDQMRPGCLFHGLAIFMQILSKISLWTGNSIPERHDAVRIDRTIAYMTENCDSPVSMEQLLKTANMSRRNFYRHFRNYTGTSPFEYLIQLRIRKAMELLRDTGHTVSEIAQLCGFSDGNYMCRIFRTRYGMPPGELRRKLRNSTVSEREILNIRTEKNTKSKR